MAVLAMEAPNSSDAIDLRAEQRKVLEAVRIIDEADVPRFAVRGQYGAGEIDGKRIEAYRDDPNTADDSQTETYAAMKVLIDNWRWHDVPFFLRTGKAMRRKLTQIVVQFRPTPHQLFRGLTGEAAPQANRLVINVQPDEGISLRFEGKVPGAGLTIRSAVMDFDYAAQFGGESPEAYAALLLDAMSGDQSLFKDRHEIEAAWRIVTPVMGHWAGQPAGDLPHYAAGSWGPAEAEALIAPHGQWRNPEGAVSRSKFVHK
jgi:glucose-6-phosphate 1-dehydrogenase